MNWAVFAPSMFGYCSGVSVFSGQGEREHLHAPSEPSRRKLNRFLDRSPSNHLCLATDILSGRIVDYLRWESEAGVRNAVAEHHAFSTMPSCLSTHQTRRPDCREARHDGQGKVVTTPAGQGADEVFAGSPLPTNTWVWRPNRSLWRPPVSGLWECSNPLSVVALMRPSRSRNEFNCMGFRALWRPLGRI